MRLRLTFAKTDAMRFTSHLDLYRTWERTLRRAGLPLAYSQGFHPHPRINIASALPLGFTGENELMDVWLERQETVQDIEHALQKALPPGLRVHRIEEVDPRAPALQSQLIACEYTLTFLEEHPNLEEHIQQLLQSITLLRQRRGKTYDLRPLIQELNLLPRDKDGHQRIRICLTANESATGRPDEVLAEMGIAPESARVHRTRLVFR